MILNIRVDKLRGFIQLRTRAIEENVLKWKEASNLSSNHAYINTNFKFIAQFLVGIQGFDQKPHCLRKPNTFGKSETKKAAW